MNMNYREAIRDNLWAEIRRKGWTFNVAADFFGICRTELRTILGCKKDVRLSTIVLLAERMDMSVLDLLSKGGADHEHA